jgi:hypothetical protein
LTHEDLIMSRAFNHPSRRPLAALLALALLGAPTFAQAQALSPAFTYQGELRLASGPANASFDMQFRLYSAQAGGSQVGSTVSRNAVAVTGGLFSVPLDFGPAQFAGDRQWLEIAIRPAGSGSFETLSPRTELTAAPYAWSAAVALTDAVTTSSIVDGTVGTADINAAQVQRRVTGTCGNGQYVRVISQTGTVTCGSDADGGGTVTSIATGAGLTGGPITSSGSIAVAAGGIGTTQINSNQVQRRVSGSCPTGQYVRVINEAGTVTCGTDASGAAGWGLSGNAGTNPATDFIGTTDAQPFVIRTRNVPSLRIEPSTILFGGLPITTNTVSGSSANSVTAGVRGAAIAGGGVPSGASDPDFSGDSPNSVTDSYGTVGGGYANRAGDAAGTATDRGTATVSGGSRNTASGSASTIGGGSNNIASDTHSTVGGGGSNAATGTNSTVGGGFGNGATGGSGSTIGGGNFNLASGSGSTIGGGGNNLASGTSNTVGGGAGNTALGSGGSTIGGGRNNDASGVDSTVGGGTLNSAGGGESTVGGGASNSAGGSASTVGGGSDNTASGVESVVVGGTENFARGNISTVGGGFGNCAGGNVSWAGGTRAKVRTGLDPGDGGACSGLPQAGPNGDRGTFVWADSQNTDFVSTGENQFLVRAAGGAAINSNEPAGNALRVAGTLRVDTLGTAAATALCRNGNNQISSCSSSARYKQDIGELDLGLDSALRLRAVGYRWKDTGALDVGFVAEEIAAIDERLVTRNGKGQIEGVKYDRLTAVLANAVQELAARDSLTLESLVQVKAANANLRSDQERLALESASLRTELTSYQARLQRLEALLSGSAKQAP